MEYHGMKFALTVTFLLLPLTLSATNIYGLNATNLTSSNSSKGSTNLDLATSIALVSAVAAALGIPTTLITNHYQGKGQRLNAIKVAFEILNDQEHRKARQTVYHAFKEYESGQNDIFKTESVIPSAAMVRADFGQIGLLIYHRLIPESIFLEAYWNTVLICWKALEDDISYHREGRDYPSYMHHFQMLKEKAELYWKEYHPETKEIKVY
jgi:hypothetical protein